MTLTKAINKAIKSFQKEVNGEIEMLVARKVQIDDKNLAIRIEYKTQDAEYANFQRDSFLCHYKCKFK